MPAPPVNCLFGPFGAQVEESIGPFGVLKLCVLFQQISPPSTNITAAKHFHNSSSIVLNAGGAVWGLDWCPATEENLICTRNYASVPMESI